MLRWLPLALLPALLALLQGPASATRLPVPGTYATISDGLAAASPGDTVWVACGTYHEHDLQIPTGVSLVSEAGDPSCATIDAQGLGSVLRINDATDVLVDGFTLTHGYTDNGGALQALRSKYVMRRCRLTDNRCTAIGSALIDARGEPVFEFCLIDSNHSLGDHQTDAVHFGSTAATMRNCTVTHNTGAANGAYWIRVLEGSAILSHVIYGWVFGQLDAVITLDCSWSGNPFYCNPGNGGDFRLMATSPCLPGGVCERLVGAMPPCDPAPPVVVQVSGPDPDVPVFVDGEAATGPTSFDWVPLSLHVVAARDTFDTADTRFLFEQWSDDATAPRDRLYLVPPDGGTITAECRRQFAVNLHAEKHGTVNLIAPWHPEGGTVVIAADPDPGFYFDRWVGTGPGSYSGPDAAKAIIVEGPIEETASFLPLRYAFTVSASDTDPWQTSAAPTGAARLLHLWLVCANGGVAALEAFTGGTLAPNAFVPLNGVLNAGTPEHLLLAIPNCPTGTVPLRLGFWSVVDNGGTLCPNLFRPNAGQVGGAVDCHAVHAALDPEAHITGFASDGRLPCVGGAAGCMEFPFGSGGPTAVAGWSVSSPALSVDPNPFRGSTRLALDLPRGTKASLVVFDVAGRRVRTLLDGRRLEGTERPVWDGRDDAARLLPAGVYFVRLDSAEGRATRKVTHLGPE